MLVVSNSFFEVVSSFKSKSKVLEFLTYTLSLKHNSEYFESKSFNFLSLRKVDEDFMISYIAENRIKDGSEIWDKEKRQTGKIGRTLRSIMKPEYRKLFTEQDFEIANNILKSTNVAGTFEVISGDEIIRTYVDMDLLSDAGTLGSSCMRYEECGEYFDIYTENEDVCQMVRLIHDSGKLMGRALLWTTSCGTKIMDRIYVSKDAHIDSFKTWAEQNGYDYKEHQAYDEKDSFINHKTKEQYTKIFKIELNNSFSQVPYIDTFTYGGRGFITNENCPKTTFFTYDNTGGYADEHDSAVCAVTNVEYRDSCMTRVTLGKYAGEYVLDELVEEINGEYKVIEDDSVEKDVDGNYIVDIDDYVEINGDLYHLDRVSWSHSEDRWFLDGDESFEWNEEEKDYILCK